jgi:hypothetical protein
MVAFASLVVVANPGHARRAEVRAVLVAVPTGRQWLGQLPDDHLDDGAIVADFLGTGEEDGVHVLHCSNTLPTGLRGRTLGVTGSLARGPETAETGTVGNEDRRKRGPETGVADHDDWK